ncbi:hypothetical protein [Flavobacterium rhizosphaerae]|uniref:Uncharacterized protein n=1 Tax=Flavobacterium rhizosphaerae TaxID=3163298 RepID=A0ABW8YUB4_9FLAO
MYNLIKLPRVFDKDVYSFDKSEAKEYFDWFKNVKNERLDILKIYVQLEYPNWNLDYDRESLIDLYSWFAKNIYLKKINIEEVKRMKVQINKTPPFSNIINIPEYIFSENTVSICFDIGVYLGETLIRNCEGVKWGQKISSKNYIDYAYPLLISKNYKVPINPRRAAESLAHDILNNSPKKENFINLFDDLASKFN